MIEMTSFVCYWSQLSEDPIFDRFPA